MKAGIWQGIGVIECGEWETPEPRPGEVLVKVHYCGFCGSDPHIIEGDLPIGRPPQVLGHEVAGTVAALGDGVRGVELGDRVACNLYGYCGSCAWCRAGQPNHCQRKHFSAKGFAEFAVYKPEQLFKLPDSVSFSVGAMLEPVATSLHAVETGEVAIGEHVLVIGGGPLGLICAQLARAAGAATVVVSEPRERNRMLALQLGVDRALDPATDNLRAHAQATGERQGFDAVFEVAGAPSALTLAPELVSTRGRVVVVGVFAREVSIPVSPFLLYDKEIAIRGALAADRTFQRALDVMPQLQLEPLITAREPLSRIAEVYTAHRAGEHVKVLVAPD
jgi:2-desacetyl-2-hydroxyethyl bacteriochlorophyllide A dehydrogenase